MTEGFERGDFLGLFIQGQRQPSTRRMYASDLRALAAFAEGGKIEPLRLREEDAIAYRDALERQGLSAATRARKLGVASAFFDFLRGRGTVSSNPFAGVKRPHVDRMIGKTPAPSKREVERLLGVMNASDPRGLRDRAIAFLLFNSGARISEALRVRLEDLSEEQGYRTIRTRGKGGRENVLVLPAEAARTIDEHVKRWPVREGFLFRARPRNDLYFERRGFELDGRPLSARSYLMALKRYALRAGLIPQRIRTHCGRTFFVTEGYARTRDLARIQRAVGHSSVSVTQRYLRYEDDIHEHPALNLRLVPKPPQAGRS